MKENLFITQHVAIAVRYLIALSSASKLGLTLILGVLLLAGIAAER